MKIFIDTNVVLDVLLKREPFFQNSFNVFKLAAERNISRIVGASSITDIYYLTRKKYSDSAKALALLFDLFDLVEIADTKASDIQSAVKLDFSDFEDSVAASTALRENADWIVTRNTKDFATSVVKPIAPTDFLKLHGAKARG